MSSPRGRPRRGPAAGGAAAGTRGDGAICEILWASPRQAWVELEAGSWGSLPDVLGHVEEGRLKNIVFSHKSMNKNCTPNCILHKLYTNLYTSSLEVPNGSVQREPRWVRNCDIGYRHWPRTLAAAWPNFIFKSELLILYYAYFRFRPELPNW
jgi:hypothetical protein